MSRRRCRGREKVAGGGRAVQPPDIPRMKRHEVQTLRRAGVGPSKVAELTGVSRRSVGRIEQEAPIRVAPKRWRRQPEAMLPLLKRHEVQVLRRAGFERPKVAKLTGVPVRTIRRIDKEAVVTTVDDREAVKARGVGRPSKAEPYRAFVAEVLEEEPGLMSLEILRRAKQKGYAGSKSALYTLIASTRPPRERPVVRFEGLPGEFSQHDFGEVDVRFVDGRKKRVHFFASRLKYSRWAQVTLVPDQTVESLVRPLLEHFHAMGGVPLVAVFDRPKTVVVKWNKDGSVIEYNPTFGQVMLELGVGVELCWPRSGNQKGSVERIVGWVKNSFFKQRRFLDEEDLEKQLAEWHVEVNTKTVSRATSVTPIARIQAERARMRPVSILSNELALRIPISVGVTAMVLFDTRSYSMPPQAIGLSGTLYLYKDKVRIVAGRFTAEHPRFTAPHTKSVLPEHRAEMVAAVSGKRAVRYYKREQLLLLGPVALEYLTELVHRRPKTWTGDVDALYDLMQLHGDGPTVYAMELALGERTFGAEYVAHFLQESALAAARQGAREVPS